MKLKTSSVVAIFLGLVAIAQIVVLWSLPSSMPTTSVEYRRGYFLLNLLLGGMALAQAMTFLSTDDKARRRIGKILFTGSVFMILAGIRIAYRHMSGV
jgi:peptidoglycan/LPS O-acetylase OafA/YrhL